MLYLLENTDFVMGFVGLESYYMIMLLSTKKNISTVNLI